MSNEFRWILSAARVTGPRTLAAVAHGDTHCEMPVDGLGWFFWPGHSQAGSSLTALGLGLRHVVGAENLGEGAAKT